MYYCPACNQVNQPQMECPFCSAGMQDSGPVTDYYGPYSPYFNTEFDSQVCRHLFTCPHCGHDRVLDIALETH